MAINYNRISIAFVLVIICIGLLSLGVKLPSFSGTCSSSKPKPRHRAIIQNQIKECKEKSCQQFHPVLVADPFTLDPEVIIMRQSPVAFWAERPHFTPDHSSRAPPFISLS